MSSVLLEDIVTRWSEIREENNADKELLTPKERKSWEEFEEKTNTQLADIINRYDGDLLSDTDRDWLQDLGRIMDGAKHVPREELEADKKAREEEKARKDEEERQRREAEELKKIEVETTKSTLLSKLKL